MRANNNRYDDSWRNNPTVSDPVWARDDVSWHDRGELQDGTPVGKLGSCWYVLDEQGNAISEGYHEIRVTEGGGKIGKLGANREPIEWHR
jgi:hypothetical protein